MSKIASSRVHCHILPCLTSTTWQKKKRCELMFSTSWRIRKCLFILLFQITRLNSSTISLATVCAFLIFHRLEISCGFSCPVQMETRLHRAISVLQFHFYYRGAPLLELKHLKAAQRVVANKDLADFYRAAKRGFSRRYLQVCLAFHFRWNRWRVG